MAKTQEWVIFTLDHEGEPHPMLLSGGEVDLLFYSTDAPAEHRAKVDKIVQDVCNSVGMPVTAYRVKLEAVAEIIKPQPVVREPLGIACCECKNDLGWQVSVTGGRVTPQMGDDSVCGSCGALLHFIEDQLAPKGLATRRITDEEFVDFPDEKRTMMKLAVHYVEERKLRAH